MLSIVIPAHNEDSCIESTIKELHRCLNMEKIIHEIIAVNDNSEDQTSFILEQLTKKISELRVVNNT